MALRETIKNESVKAGIVADCMKLMDTQVAAKKGLSGMGLKAAYGVVKGVGQGYVPGAIGRLLPEAFAALEPMWLEGLEAGDPVAYISKNRSQAADTLLSVTDQRISRSDGIVRSSYNKLRKSVKGDVEAAMPGLAEIINTHTAKAMNV
jgi:predicted outer membrane lipoprotein